MHIGKIRCAAHTRQTKLTTPTTIGQQNASVRAPKKTTKPNVRSSWMAADETTDAAKSAVAQTIHIILDEVLGDISLDGCFMQKGCLNATGNYICVLCTQSMRTTRKRGLHKKIPNCPCAVAQRTEAVSDC